MTTKLQGFADERFAAVQEALQRRLDAGTELGASVAVTLDGEPVVDLWGGWADVERTRPWERDTLTNVWSVTKTVTGLAALVLVERGELDVYQKVAHYWPEFAAQGKAEIEVRHLLGHTSGLSGWEAPFAMEDMYDWDRSTSLLAAQAPWWEPGTASGYHAMTYGHLVGEVVRRITGDKLGAFVAKEIAGPLGADFHIGLDPADFARVSVNVPPSMPEPAPASADAPAAPPVDPGSVAVKTFTGPVQRFDIVGEEGWLRADIGAANGQGNARSVARLQSVVSNGGEVDGVRLLSPATIDLIFDEQANGVDLAIGIPLAFGIGYGLPQPESVAFVPTGRRCYWIGAGGATVVNDLENRMTVAYVPNQLAFDLPMGSVSGAEYIRAAFAAVSSR
ncbi:MAG: serine hydrolase domain-containing protein [Janthinobacterium lividum]